MKPADPPRWHDTLCKVIGYLNISIEKKKVGSATLRDCATRLEQVAKEMREAAAFEAQL